MPDDVLPAYSDEIWKQMQLKAKNAWSSHCWFVNVRHNRRNIFTKARKQMGLETVNTSINLSRYSENSSHLDHSYSTQPAIISDSELEDESWFDFVLSSEVWNKIKPDEEAGEKRTNHTLRPKVWTNVLSKEFWKQFRLPCAYVFKRAEINISDFLKIQGQCSDIKCGNHFNGYAYSEPCKITGEITIRVRIRDTSQENHSLVKRPLNGERRNYVGKAAFGEGTNNLTKKMNREQLQRGEMDNPIIPTNNAVRHAKKEWIDEDLGAKKQKGEDIIQTIYRLRFENPYAGSIQDTGYCPFYVFYGTTEQRTVYTKYRHLNLQTYYAEY